MIKARLAKYENEQVKKELDFIINSIKSFFSEIELEVDYETKFDVIRKLVQRIEIDNDNVHIVFRLKEFTLERQRQNIQHCIGMPISNTSVTKESTEITSRLQEILLTARCDRVEYLSNEQVAIIDYKLGSPPSNEEVMSGFFPQLILQALAVKYTTKKEVLELAYWKLDYDRIKVIALKDYKQKIEEFQNDLPDFLSNYLRDMTPFIASPYFDKLLRFNSYKQLERVGEWL
ncbi:MAG: RecB family exonuclease [Wolbachia sp.]